MENKEICLRKSSRNDFILEIEQLYDIYSTRLVPVFANIAQEAAAIADNEYDKKMQSTNYNDNFDPSDCAEEAIYAGNEYYQMLSIMQYRNLCMWISCMCQMWEQQLYKFIIDESRHCSIQYDDKDKRKGFKFIKDTFLKFGVEFENLKYWPTIKELRLLVNVIKHAEGDAEEKLRIINEKYFNKPEIMFGIDHLKISHNTLLEETLNVTIEDFNKFKVALVAFWSELPSKMYYTENQIKGVQNERKNKLAKRS